MVRAFIKSDRRGQRFVLADADTADEMQVSGEWIATTDPVAIEP